MYMLLLFQSLVSFCRAGNEFQLPFLVHFLLFTSEIQLENKDFKKLELTYTDRRL